MAVSASDTHLFGVTPPAALLALGVASLVVGVVLFVLDNVVVGLLLAGVGLVLLLLFLRTARRRSESRLARATADTLDAVRDRAGYYARAVTTVSAARRALARGRAEIALLADERRRLMQELGAAAYADDDAAVARVRTAIAGLDARIDAREREMAAVAAQAREHVRREQLQVQATEVAQVPPPPDTGAPPQP